MWCGDPLGVFDPVYKHVESLQAIFLQHPGCSCAARIGNSFESQNSLGELVGGWQEVVLVGPLFHSFMF
jgi:hypothetical protein